MDDLLRDAISHFQAGRLAQAEQICRHMLGADARQPDALNLLGVIFFQAGRADVGVELIAQAISINGQNAGYYFNLGNGEMALGQLDKAIVAFENAVRINPDFADAHANLGHALSIQSRYAQAIIACENALRLRPDLAEAYSNLGNARNAMGRPEDAIANFIAALRINPHMAEAHTNLGQALIGLNRYDEAIPSLKAALVLRPDFASGYINFGSALVDLGRFEDAIKVLSAATLLNPYRMLAHYNLGNALSGIGRYGQAVDAFAAANRIAPEYASAQYNGSLALLALGNFERGFAQYEWRWLATGKQAALDKFKVPQWRGEAIDGKTILIHAEQGMGDCLQFCRYVPLIAARGGQVILSVHPRLKRLLKRLAGTLAIVTDGDPAPNFDYHCPMMSLPLAFKTRIATVPAHTPYLSAEPALIAHWHDLLGAGQFKIGIAWQGNPDSPVERGRSMPLKALAPLARIAGVRLISLQQIHGLDQLADLPPGMVVERLDQSVDAGEDGFVDTAAIIANLDLVISTDTALAHLAGALGKPVWIVLKHLPEWRWMQSRPDSPWYPTARLFRQPEIGRWDLVVADMVESLGPYVAPNG